MGSHWRSSGPSRWARYALVGVIATLAASACGSSGTGSNATWIDGIIAPKGDAGFEYMAQARGYFKRQGVNVKIETFLGSVQLTQALLAGAIDSAEVDPSAALKADLQGAKLEIIGSTLPGLTYDIVGKASIKSASELRGKTIATSSPGGLPDEFTRALLASKAINPNSINVVAAGTDEQRYLALLHGRVDATALSAEFEPRIDRNHRFRVIARSQDVLPLYPRLILVANADSLKRKRRSVVGFLAGEIQGISYALAHRAAEIALSARILHKPTGDPGIAYLYSVIARTRAASPTAEIPMARLNWLVEFDYAHHLLPRKPDLQQLTDSTYRRQALARLDMGG